jgi:CheY-like chemotaxis protein
MRILIVEDDPIVAITAAAALEDAGHIIVGPAYDADEAWRMVSISQPDLALVDVNLAGKDEGLALAQRFKDFLGLPSVYVTGQVAAARDRRDSALGVLSKPYDPQVLAATVEAARAIIAGVVHQPRHPTALEIFHA